MVCVDTWERFASPDLDRAWIVENTHSGKVPLACLEALMRSVPADRYFLTAAALPFGSPGLARELDRQIGDADACLIQRKGGG